jgi:hypothetical protein
MGWTNSRYCTIDISSGSVTDVDTGEVFTRRPDVEDRHVTGGRSGLGAWRRSVHNERNAALSESRRNIIPDDETQNVFPKADQVSETDLRHPDKPAGWPVA